MKPLTEYINESLPVDMNDTSLPRHNKIRKRFYMQLADLLHSRKDTADFLKNQQRFYEDTEFKYSDGDIKELADILFAIERSQFTKIVYSSESPAAAKSAADYFHKELPGDLSEKFNNSHLIDTALSIFKYQVYEFTLVDLDRI